MDNNLNQLGSTFVSLIKIALSSNSDFYSDVMTQIFSSENIGEAEKLSLITILTKESKNSENWSSIQDSIVRTLISSLVNGSYSDFGLPEQFSPIVTDELRLQILSIVISRVVDTLTNLGLMVESSLQALQSIPEDQLITLLRQPDPVDPEEPNELGE